MELIPGKSEKSLLLQFEDNCHLWRRGQNEDSVAYIEAAVFGCENHVGYTAFTMEVSRIFQEVLKIPKENIYIRYEDIPAWGQANITSTAECSAKGNTVWKIQRTAGSLKRSLRIP